MVRKVLLLIAAMTPLLGCSASLRQPMNTTEAATQLTQVTHAAGDQFDPAVSPDGKTIAYESAESPGDKPHVEVTSIHDLLSGRPARPAYSSKQATGLEPAWSSDGSALVFQSDALGPDRLVETMGDGVAMTRFLGQIGDSELSGGWPAMSPDGQKVALTLGPIKLYQTDWRTSIPLSSSIGLTDLAGTGTTVLGSGADPAWSPDGKRIAFVRVADGHTHVYVARADGTGATQITDGPEDDREPAWSPDARFIAYCAVHANDHGWTLSNLSVVRPDGSALTQLTEGDRLAGRPDWARDGYIYFHANATDRFHIWRIEPVGDLRAQP
jgi:Tol biopolymer transport system component